MKALVLALAGVALLGLSAFLFVNENKAVPQEIAEQFEQWKETYNKAYADPALEAYRLNVFYDNVKYINKVNSKGKSYTFAINKFSDLTKAEFKAIYLTGIIIDNTDNEVVEEDNSIVQDSINWVDKGAVTDIKDQGQCGSCWAFSTTGVCEGADFIGKGTLQSFSEQQLMDCSGSYGNEGCNGGWPKNALKYVAAQGITTEDKYPYKAVDQDCQIEGGDFKVNSPKQGFLCSGLKKALNKQPISVAVDAENWSPYSSGVFDDCTKNIDHAVLAVGYDSDGNWLIKNSWGTDWGEKGYIQLASGDTCAVCEYPVWATAA